MAVGQCCGEGLVLGSHGPTVARHCMPTSSDCWLAPESKAPAAGPQGCGRHDQLYPERPASRSGASWPAVEKRLLGGRELPHPVLAYLSCGQVISDSWTLQTVTHPSPCFPPAIAKNDPFIKISLCRCTHWAGIATIPDRCPSPFIQGVLSYLNDNTPSLVNSDCTQPSWAHHMDCPFHVTDDTLSSGGGGSSRG
jgi:hypothetical protein